MARDLLMRLDSPIQLFEGLECPVVALERVIAQVANTPFTLSRKKGVSKNGQAAGSSVLKSVP
jgi:hypothetical protein